MARWQCGRLVPAPMTGSRRLAGRLFLLCLATAAAGVRANAADIEVPKDLPSIQAAIDVARPGDTIKIRPGVYDEQISISKSLKLKGAGRGTTIIQAPDVLVPSGQNQRIGLPVATIVEITDGATVQMSDLTVSGPGPCGVDTLGIAVLKNATLKITDAGVTRIRPEGPCPSDQASGRAVVIGLPEFVELAGEPAGGSIGHATIAGIAIDKYQSFGIGVTAPFSGPPSTAAILKNLIVGGADIPAVQSGINT